MDGREVAEMISKDHAHLLRDISGYIKKGCDMDQPPNLGADVF